MECIVVHVGRIVIDQALSLQIDDVRRKYINIALVTTIEIHNSNAYILPARFTNYLNEEN